MTPNQEAAEAWARVFQDRAIPGDGIKIVLWLRSKQLALSPVGASSCAVHDHEGHRRLAAQILTFAEPAEHDHRTDADDARSDLARQRAGRSVSAGSKRPRGAGRRVPPGWGEFDR